MLKPFQVRDLHLSSDAEGEHSDSPHGVVQISAIDYDGLASSHPRARLTYLDDDDGDQITVGSSLELSQRLDEPLGIDARLGSIQLSQNEPNPMHIFDIRRSNSVTELWKRFEATVDNGPMIQKERHNDPATLEPTVDSPEHEESHPSGITTATLASADEPQPFMAAFEAELANILGSAEETSESEATQPESSRAAESSANTEDPPRALHPAEILATQVLQHLVNGASLVQSELRSKLPELQRQLRDAQRTLPENVGASLQSILATLEARIKTALNNLPEGGRNLAEEAIHARRPMAESAADGLRFMASEFNEVGRTLFAAFEHEFGRATAQDTGSTPDASNTTPGAFRDPASNGAVLSSLDSHETGARYVDPATQERQATNSDKSPAAGPGASHVAASPDAKITHQSAEAGTSLGHGLTPPFNGPRFFPAPPPFPPTRPTHWPLSWQSFAHFNPPPPHHSSFPAPPPLAPYSGQHWPFHPQPGHQSSFVDPPYQSVSSYSQRHNEVPPALSVNKPSDNAELQTEDLANKTLFIGNVGFNVTERIIQDVFASRGFIVDVDLPLDSVSGKHAGFGYLHFPSIHPAMAAMDVLQGAHIDGHAINLEFSESMPIDALLSSRSSVENVNSRSRGCQQSDTNTPVSQDLTSKPQDVIHFGPGQALVPQQGFKTKRAKSVAFQEPSQPVADNSELNSQSPATRPVSPPLIDLSTDGSSTARTTSLRTGEEGRHQVNDNDPGYLPVLSSDLEMSRFPPVSQFEAQLLAAQQQERASASDSLSASHQRPYVPSVRPDPIPESLPQRARTLSHTHGARGVNRSTEGPELFGSTGTNSRGHAGPSLRRSNTVEFGQTRTRQHETSSTISSGEPQSASRLRRRASERHALRSHAQQFAGLDTWARLDRRERQRSRPRSSQDIPVASPIEGAHRRVLPEGSVADTQTADVEKCVSSLLDMGYGSAQDGGRSRMTVYAAASNGSLLDAIEMIEEERQAYARRHDL
ncbi:uncharacterized protein N7459_008588 [Penicillium hispanicum]|uniref:uncharacterized protein n=1 Tax=Penicillium hispanicum TaxID=1080232 RepID=UPI0025410F41|nr:uncharacterized protein N7459_008588 [Penicillium hispanicum]KAJ5574161.1 hypothetical protein N7459_008588 [Penicillium hispanicum]